MLGAQVRLAIVVAFAALAFFSVAPAFAGSSGSISGSVVSAASGSPVAGAIISATAPTGTYKATSDAKGFYSLLNLTPDTYTLTISAASFDVVTIPGVSVFQDQTLVIGAKLNPSTHVLGHVTATGQRTNLVQPNVTSNTYNVTAKQMSTVLNDSTHHTLYDVLWRTPGITSGPSNGSPTIRGGTTTELGWEFEGVPIVDRTVGFYTTELSTTGLSNVEVTTGGLTASQGGSNGGVINMVVKQGSYPAKADFTYGVNKNEFSNTIDYEYGNATPNNTWSWFLAGSIANGDNIYGKPGTFYYENIESFDFVNTKDNLLNLKHTWGSRSQNALQFVLDNGVGLFRSSYGGAQGTQLVIANIDANGNYVLAPKNNGDAWYHWYNVNQLAFSHSFNDRSYLVARLAQSRNGYYFDEQWAANRGEPCFTYDGYYQDGSAPYTPVAGCTLQPGPDPNFNFWGYGIYYQDRHTLQTISNIEYANQLNDRNQLKFGTSYEMDSNFRKVADPTSTSFNNTFPDYYSVTEAPTYLYSSYASDHFQSGKWVVEPGVRWDMEHYAISPVIDPTTHQPAYGSAAPFNESFLSPRLGITYQAGEADVFRFVRTSRPIHRNGVCRRFLDRSLIRKRAGASDLETAGRQELRFLVGAPVPESSFHAVVAILAQQRRLRRGLPPAGADRSQQTSSLRQRRRDADARRGIRFVARGSGSRPIDVLLVHVQRHADKRRVGTRSIFWNERPQRQHLCQYPCEQFRAGEFRGSVVEQSRARLESQWLGSRFEPLLGDRIPLWQRPARLHDRPERQTHHHAKRRHVRDVRQRGPEMSLERRRRKFVCRFAARAGLVQRKSLHFASRGRRHEGRNFCVQSLQ